MPKIKVSATDHSTVEASSGGGGGSNYTGKMPPAGKYKVRTRLFRTSKNSKKDWTFWGFVRIEETGKKAKFNGYDIKFNQNITAQGAPYVNQMIEALGLSKAAVWKNGVVTDKESDGSTAVNVTKIGKSPLDIVCTVVAKVDKYQGERKLVVNGWFPYDPDAEEADDDDSDEDDSDDGDDDDDDDDDDDSDDDDDDDDDEEPF